MQRSVVVSQLETAFWTSFQSHNPVDTFQIQQKRDTDTHIDEFGVVHMSAQRRAGLPLSFNGNTICLSFHPETADLGLLW